MMKETKTRFRIKATQMNTRNLKKKLKSPLKVPLKQRLRSLKRLKHRSR
jgi:hypothetical protein